jgi:GAF domain-containing protein
MFVAAIIAGVVSGASIIMSGQSDEVGTPFITIFYLLLAWITYLLLRQVQATLAQSRAYAEALEKSRDQLETEVAERTSELQKSFDLTRQVSTLASNSTTLDDLFEHAVELIQETFHFYHVHIYTYDEHGETLNLAYGPGEVGQRLIEQRHKIEIGQGIVGQVARTNRTLIVNEVNSFPGFAPNPLLPETRAEMAVPLRAGTTLLAVLDIQSDRRNSFSETDRNLMRALANQLAVAINNIHLVTEAREALAQVEELNARLTKERWEQALQQAPVSGYVYTPNTLTPTVDDWLPAMQKVMMQENSGQSAELVVLEQDEANNELAIPIKLRGQLIGVLGVERPPHIPWTDDEEAVIQAVSEQIALALESARLFEDTQRNAWRDQVVSETTARVWSSAEMEAVMQAAIAQLGQQLGASEVVIQLMPQATLETD